MSNILTIGYATEGTTDQRFLESIIKKTFDDVALECENDIEVFDPIFIKVGLKGTFIENSISIARKAFETGLHVLCIHVDADSSNDNNVLNNKIKPSFDTIKVIENGVCKNLVAVIPIQMSEAWMLADKELLKEEIGTRKSDDELGFNKHPEKISNPKASIEYALRIAQEDFPNRRNKISISELYQPIGQQISIERLSQLESYKNFRTEVVKSFKTLNYLR